MKRLSNILAGISLGIIVTAFIVVFLPMMVVVAPFTYYFNWARERELKEYLKGLGHKNFFCYSNRADAKVFIEKVLIPKLDKDIELIYLDGRELKSGYEMSLALYKLKNYTRFPHLLKIRNGQMIDESVNNEFFNTMTQKKSPEKLLTDINRFFDLSIDNNSTA